MAHVFNKLQHLISKSVVVGPARFLRAVHCRVAKRRYSTKMRTLASRGDHGANWELFCKSNHITVGSFDSICDRPLSFIDAAANQCNKRDVILCADDYIDGYFDLLGSGRQWFEHMPWHKDFRLFAQNPQSDCLFDATLFYDDICIQVGKGKKVAKDIKVPWELSRFQHLPIMSLAYSYTHDERYADAAKHQVIDWLDNNPYLFGVNWASAMEVAIRSVNWIVSWQWLAKKFKDDESFCKRMICSLYDHMQYLEHTWELYDGRTSNHYLSNLVGYFYLCWFFEGTIETGRKRDWCYRELVREFEWQLFDEGTSYEGSTRYHVLVTELLMHAFELARVMGIKGVEVHTVKLERMLSFIAWCKPTAEDEPIAIGDDDSGSLLHKKFFHVDRMSGWLYKRPGNVHGVKRYKKFGLSIMKNADWHITLRHHAYKKRQPSGHFHADMASVTMAYQGCPILIDPGSYVYTASDLWRNQFRAARMHNTIFVEGEEPVSIDKHLFALNLPERDVGDMENNQAWKINAKNELYPQLCLEREVSIESNQCVIRDHVGVGCDFDISRRIIWNFLCAPGITIQMCEDGWHIFNNEVLILTMNINPSVAIEPYDSWCSPHYGKKICTQGFRIIKPGKYDVLTIIFAPV